MGDHFVLLMDRLITASTLEAAIESRNLVRIPAEDEKTLSGDSMHKWKLGDEGSGFLAPKLVECRICQEEEPVGTMESPCACCGSLKYAHRKCIQRWCNEKGDTICEICNQPFKPDYTAPPRMFHYGGIPMNFSGSWEISRQDARNSQFISMVATDRSFLDSDCDEDAVYNTRSALCCRSVAFLFMVLLILRHGVSIAMSEVDDEYAFTIFASLHHSHCQCKLWTSGQLLVLRVAGILVPAYIILRLVNVYYRQ